MKEKRLHKSRREGHPQQLHRGSVRMWTRCRCSACGGCNHFGRWCCMSAAGVSNDGSITSGYYYTIGAM